MGGGKQSGKTWMQTPAICKTGFGQAPNLLLTCPLKTVFQKEGLRLRDSSRRPPLLTLTFKATGKNLLTASSLEGTVPPAQRGCGGN